MSEVNGDNDNWKLIQSVGEGGQVFVKGKKLKIILGRVQDAFTKELTDEEAEHYNNLPKLTIINPIKKNRNNV